RRPAASASSTCSKAASTSGSPKKGRRRIALERWSRILSRARSRRRLSRRSGLADRQLLHSEVADFADIERALAAAVDRVDRAELLQQLARPAELSDHRSVELHLV